MDAGPRPLEAMDTPPIVRIVEEPCNDPDYDDCDFEIVVYVNGEHSCSWPFSDSSQRRDQLRNAIESLEGELGL